MTGKDPEHTCGCTDTQSGEPCEQEVPAEGMRCRFHPRTDLEVDPGP
jgi:hypothetical protein